MQQPKRKLLRLWLAWILDGLAVIAQIVIWVVPQAPGVVAYDLWNGESCGSV